MVSTMCPGVCVERRHESNRCSVHPLYTSAIKRSLLCAEHVQLCLQLGLSAHHRHMSGVSRRAVPKHAHSHSLPPMPPWKVYIQHSRSRMHTGACEWMEQRTQYKFYVQCRICLEHGPLARCSMCAMQRWLLCISSIQRLRGLPSRHIQQHITGYFSLHCLQPRNIHRKCG